MPQISTAPSTISGASPVGGDSSPDSAAGCIARSIQRDLQTLAGLPGHDRVRSTYLSPVRPQPKPVPPAIAA